MKDFIPLFQTLVWPTAIGIVAVFYRDSIQKVLTALSARVENGAPVKAGAFEIGAVPTLPAVSRGDDPRHLNDLPHDIYISHWAWRDVSLDTPDHLYFRLRIFLDADTPQRISEVTEVTYRLHPTFKDPVRRVTEPQDNFELRTIAWGEFNMTAEVTFSSGKKLVIERYINLVHGIAT